MRRNIQHPRILIEHPLRAITVVNIVVDDCHAPSAKLKSMGCSDRNVVVQTEAHRAASFGVMPRRANQRKGPRQLGRARQNPIDCRQRGTRRGARRGDSGDVNCRINPHNHRAGITVQQSGPISGSWTAAVSSRAPALVKHRTASTAPSLWRPRAHLARCGRRDAGRRR